MRLKSFKMKKLSFLLLVFCFFTTANAQIVDIPDAKFKAKLLAASSSNTTASTETSVYNSSNNSWSLPYYNKVDTNGDGEIQISEAKQIKYLYLNNSSITDLRGIEAFTNLQTLLCDENRITNLNVSALINLVGLNCNNNQLTTLDVSTCINLQILSCSSNRLTSLNVSGSTKLVELACTYNQLTSLDVLGCTNLKNLYCGTNRLISLDVSFVTNLQTLNCSYNRLESLIVFCINLKTLNCQGNLLTSLDVSICTNLQILFCGHNQLASLYVSDLMNLVELECSVNQMTTLNVLGCTNLQRLNCSYNQLTSLDISNCTNLVELVCSVNQLTSIDVYGCINLETLYCAINQLTKLEVSDCTNLSSLTCDRNQLATLDISQLKKLEYLSCRYNQLTSLDISELRSINSLLCEFNNLISIFVKNGIDETLQITDNPSLKYICVDETQFTTVQEQVNNLGYTNCSISTYCSFTLGGTFYTIQGNQKIDANKNGCDANDIIMPNFKYNATNGTTTGSFISDASGNYSIPVQTGTHTISPKLENPSYFTISPTSTTVTFPTQTSPFIQNFCITPNGIHNDLEVTLIPLAPARPGFDSKYKLVYKNKGNQTQSGSVNLNFNDAVLDLVVANPATTAQTLNNLSWNFTNLQPFETREITFTMNVNSPMETPAVNNDDILAYTSTITSSAIDETPTDNTFTFNQTVVSSYDPNDKTCLEGSVITPALIGQYVHYMIRFENTGTFAAENVVVKDMIDLSKFDILTLVPTSASHSYTTRISDGNKVEFIFENINLPFDDANNDGYIAFKIKTKPTLVVNDSFTNEASIFFDYNFPILTNKATSTFKTLGTPDYDFDCYFTVYPNPAKDILNITTKETINTQSMQVYNTLGQLVLVVTNADKTAIIDVSSLTAGNYFLQIKTDKGSSSSQFMKE